ncbi:sugar ABC transporter substrate-binding protein [Flexivirga oryzae]|uniref:Arabinogalactan oligomer/maltooligosaccharide transport system substrate-binding protein n=1 Tax=Flexivirga oryzae TaxID=1794944 RepID=A0A839N9C8_9MICO|nr:maltose ABC transporter substrate-binding protein [Flexivirga oryzae]MBB2892773.1 arabinogalactan oligomer/maltooligosaccharide transport system substrate-binding protein [Flexivirga oryzae]
MIKRTLAVALASATALTLAGCGGSSSGGSKSSAAGTDAGTSAAATGGSKSTAAAAPTEVSTKNPSRDKNADLVIWADATSAPYVRQLATQFGKANGIKVAVQIANDVRGQYETAFKAGQAPDVIVGANDWTGELVANGAIAPVQLPANVASGFNKQAIAATKFNNQTYAVPYGVENLALVRNTELAPTAPKTMDELVSMGQKLKKDGKVTNILSDQVGKTGNAYNGYPFLSACGGGIFGTKANGDYDPSKVLVGSAGSIKGATEMANLGKVGALSTNIDSTNSDTLFATKKTAFEITGPWSIPAFKKAGIKYSIDPLPTVAGCGAMQPFLGVQMFFVSSKAKNATVAQTFVTSFLTTKSAQETLFKVGQRPPALTAAYDDVVKSDPDVAKWAAAAKGGKLMPNIPAMNSVWGPLGQAMADVVSGKSQPKARFDKAQQEIVKNIAKG